MAAYCSVYLDRSSVKSFLSAFSFEKKLFLFLLNGTFLVWKLTLHNFRQKNLSVSGCAVRIDVEHSVKHSIRKVIRKNFQGRKWISTHCFSKIIFINGNLWWLFQNKITKFHGPQSYISRSAHTKNQCESWIVYLRFSR